MSSKELRDKIMGAKVTKDRIKVKTENMGDVEIEIEEPGLGDMGKIYRLSTFEEIVIELLINHSFVPGTDEKIFDKNDRIYLTQNVKMNYTWVWDIFNKAKEWAGEEDPIKKLKSIWEETVKSTTDTQSVSDSEVVQKVVPER